MKSDPRRTHRLFHRRGPSTLILISLLLIHSTALGQMIGDPVDVSRDFD